ncbi:MAG: hypothetical protein B2I17_09095 [Thermoplasmatales archaeon B_DKE]|nr:MAG: hypothetical protein B2I17_09095 [Thermoplasmatales archaeon B_DKE]
MQTSERVVMAYIKAMDEHRYDAAEELLDQNIKIYGPAGEGFGGPKGFISMMRKFPGRYDLKKMFVDRDDVCLLYDFGMEGKSVYMSSWYKVRNGKIEFIRTIFDPRAFDDPA